MSDTAWGRERWADAQINACCSELERDLASIQKDRTLTIFQKSVLSHVAVEAAATSLMRYETVRGAA